MSVAVPTKLSIETIDDSSTNNVLKLKVQDINEQYGEYLWGVSKPFLEQASHELEDIESILHPRDVFACMNEGLRADEVLSSRWRLVFPEMEDPNFPFMNELDFNRWRGDSGVNRVIHSLDDNKSSDGLFYPGESKVGLSNPNIGYSTYDDLLTHHFQHHITFERLSTLVHEFAHYSNWGVFGYNSTRIQWIVAPKITKDELSKDETVLRSNDYYKFVSEWLSFGMESYLGARYTIKDEDQMFEFYSERYSFDESFTLEQAKELGDYLHIWKALSGFDPNRMAIILRSVLMEMGERRSSTFEGMVDAIRYVAGIGEDDDIEELVRLSRDCNAMEARLMNLHLIHAIGKGIIDRKHAHMGIESIK